MVQGIAAPEATALPGLRERVQAARRERVEREAFEVAERQRREREEREERVALLFAIRFHETLPEGAIWKHLGPQDQPGPDFTVYVDGYQFRVYLPDDVALVTVRACCGAALESNNLHSLDDLDAAEERLERERLEPCERCRFAE